MQHIIINKPQTEETEGKSNPVLNQVEMGDHFNDFVLSQSIGPKPDGSYKEKGLTPA